MRFFYIICVMAIAFIGVLGWAEEIPMDRNHACCPANETCELLMHCPQHPTPNNITATEPDSDDTDEISDE